MSTLRITPIGTCRIHTPLKRGALRYPIEVDLNRNYGYVHSAAEALQLIRFLEREQDIPEEIAPLVVREGTVEQQREEIWRPADLHIVEISSAKKLMCGDYAVQMNYIYRYFADFFASAQRARTFWGLVRRGHLGDLKIFLREEPTYRLLSQADRELLLGLRLEQQSFKAIKSEMGDIVDRLGSEKLIFVSHVNARTPDEELIPSRDRLIRWVKLAAEQLDTRSFDPTEAMREVGQELALDNAGLDLTHYTTAFSDRIYDELHQKFVGALTSDAETGDAGVTTEGAAALVASQFEAMLQVGDFFEVSKKVHDAIARSPDSLSLVEVRGLIRFQIGDYFGAVEDLTKRDDKALSQSARTALLSSLTRTGEFERALKVATGLINDEYESAELYASASQAAEKLGRTDKAISYAKQAFRLNRNDLQSALLALRQLFGGASTDLAAQWRQEILEHIGESSSGTFELCQWAVENRDEELFAATIGLIGDKSAVIDLVEEAFNAELYGAVADSVETLVGLGRLTPELAKRRSAMIEEILDKSGELFEAGHGSSAYRCATALAALAETSSSQLRTARLASLADRQIRTWLRDTRKKIRDAEERGPAEVIQIANDAGELVRADPAIAVAVARAFDDEQGSVQALRILKAADTDDGEDHLVRRWTARIATHAGEYGIALDTYGALARDETVPTKLRSEAERVLKSIRTQAIQQMRDLVKADSFEEALALATSISRNTSEVERVQRELARMYKRLRGIVLETEQGEGEKDELERILRMIILIRPEDQSMLRRLALELMRQSRFAEAAEIWERVQTLDPDNESAARALARCATLARRRAGSELNAAA